MLKCSTLASSNFNPHFFSIGIVAAFLQTYGFKYSN